MILHVLRGVLASCVLDPKHPNAPCNDTPGPPLWLDPFVIILALAAIAAVVAMVWLVVSSRPSGGSSRRSDVRRSRSPSWPTGPGR